VRVGLDPVDTAAKKREVLRTSPERKLSLLFPERKNWIFKRESIISMFGLLLS
jgi:hypothetical protein